MMEKKTAFTLSELLIVFMLIGIITIASLYTINNRATDFFTRYYTAFDALNKAVYNTYTDTYCRVKGVSATGTSDCTTKDQRKAGRAFPGDTATLCNRLKEYLNAAQGIGKCSGDKGNIIITANDDAFTDNKIQFALTNGFRFYLSGPKSISIKNNTIGYFVAYIDLNGSGKPNKFGIENNARPDIVPFVILKTGEVIPIGYPIYDTSYATARILNSQGEQTKSYTIREAAIMAYGHDPYTDIPFSLVEVFENRIAQVTGRKVTPSGAIPAASILTTYNGKDFDCAEGTYSCVMKIDENLEKRY